VPVSSLAILGAVAAEICKHKTAKPITKIRIDLFLPLKEPLTAASMPSVPRRGDTKAFRAHRQCTRAATVPDPFEVLAAPGKYWKDHAAMPGSFEHLLSPLQVGPKLLRNRVLISAHVPRLAVDNLPGAAYIAYHRVRARGGAGLQITGATAVHPTGTLGTPNSLENLDDRIVPGYRQLADAVHGEGGTILAQLAHSAATLNVSDAGRPLWAPSPVQSELARETPHEMTRDDIAEMIAAYRAAALRVREGGLDGIELLAAFGFLIAAFLSPLTNKREDAYGGSPDKRLRFALEVVSAVREAVGPERILGMRIPGEEGVAGGLTRDDMRTIAVRLAETGRLDYLNVIVGTNYSRMQRMAHWGPTPLAHGVYVPLAANIKSAVGIPVFAAGRITEPKLADAIIRDGKADMVAMTRAHIADPDIVRKIREGRAGEVRPCVGANVCISLTGGPLRCFHNPSSAGGSRASRPRASRPGAATRSGSTKRATGSAGASPCGAGRRSPASSRKPSPGACPSWKACRFAGRPGAGSKATSSGR
jgi:2,4-dienoyl-CoA reductase-like NADH-dependent reductase (Old Yellow Enzyme family)